MNFLGYRRTDGSIGIRNKILVVAVDECCEGIARNIAKKFDEAVVLTNWYTCMLGGNEETYHQIIETGKHPNIVGVLIVAMGCGSFPIQQMANEIGKTGKKVFTLTCQEVGGTRRTIDEGIRLIGTIKKDIDGMIREKVDLKHLIVGVKCGGSDTSSGIASNPSVGVAVDKLVDSGAICIGGELFELQGCQEILKKRAVSPQVGEKITRLIDKEAKRWTVEGVDIETMSVGNCVGGITTIEEKSLGALYKTGARPIVDALAISKDGVEKPKEPGLYLSDVTMLCGGAGVNFASLGAHIILWTTGAAGFNNPIVPVIRVSGNSDLFNEDMDIDAAGIMESRDSVESVSEKIVEKIIQVASGEKTAIEDVGESTLTLYQKDRRLETLLGHEGLNRKACRQ